MRNKALILAMVFLTSCQVYSNRFDCPPCEGVPCTSVSEIQRMIIETPEGGPDIFLGKTPSTTCSDCSKRRCRTHTSRSSTNTEKKRIWVEGSVFGCSNVEGHYIYFDENCQSGVCDE